MIPAEGKLVDLGPTIREDTLMEAKRVVSHDRNQQYGGPEENFGVIANMWSAFLGIKIQAHEVAVMEILIKVARARVSPEKWDHWVDIAGYAACGAEVRPHVGG